MVEHLSCSNLIKIWIKEGVVIKDDNHFKINDNYKSTWSRIRKLVDTLGNQILNIH